MNYYTYFGRKHVAVSEYSLPSICHNLWDLFVHLLQDCERLKYRRPQIPHIFISVAVRASLTQLLTYLSGIYERVLVIPPNPDKVTGSATTEMVVCGNRFWGVKRLLKVLLLSLLNKF